MVAMLITAYQTVTSSHRGGSYSITGRSCLVYDSFIRNVHSAELLPDNIPEERLRAPACEMYHRLQKLLVLFECTDIWTVASTHGPDVFHY